MRNLTLKYLIINKMDNTEKYIITYTNQLDFAGKLLSFRKKELFDLTNGTPRLIKGTIQGWYIGKNLLTIAKAKELIIEKPIKIDVSNLQWYLQEQLNH